LLLDYFYFRFTTLQGLQTPGLKLLNLRFNFRNNAHKMYYLLVKMFLPYVYERFRDYIERNDWGKLTNKRGNLRAKLRFWCAFFVKFIGKLSQVVELVNFLGFMNGRKFARRSVAEAILGVNLELEDANAGERSLSFDYVNIIVVWTAIGRSLTHLLPFMDFSKLSKLVESGTSHLTQTITFNTGDQDEQVCLVCGATEICMPVWPVPCKCTIYCYYCLQSSLIEKPCLKCSKSISSSEKYDLSNK
jgi:hypothetical protein